jgi:hypothetical protein
VREAGDRIDCGQLAAGKGRVERVHGTHQDRLVKKLRLERIASHTEANAYLESEYLPSTTGGLRVRPGGRRTTTVARPAPRSSTGFFRLETTRAISNDWVVRYDNRFFQLEPRSEHYAPAGGQVLACEWSDGRLDIEHRGRPVRWREIAVVTRPPVAKRTRVPAPLASKAEVGLPPADHPWRQAARIGREAGQFVGLRR